MPEAQVDFKPGLPGEEILAVERQCCRVVRLGLDRTRRRLTIVVEDASQRPALDALSFALTAETASSSKPEFDSSGPD
jgi:hypothetical protein